VESLRRSFAPPFSLHSLFFPVVVQASEVLFHLRVIRTPPPQRYLPSSNFPGRAPDWSIKLFLFLGSYVFQWERRPVFNLFFLAYLVTPWLIPPWSASFLLRVCCEPPLFSDFFSITTIGPLHAFPGLDDFTAVHFR